MSAVSDKVRDVVYRMTVDQLQRLLLSAGKKWRFKDKNLLRRRALKLFDWRSASRWRTIRILYKHLFNKSLPNSPPSSPEIKREVPVPALQVIPPSSITGYSIPSHSSEYNAIEFHTVHFDVKLKHLPFFDLLSKILPPTHLGYFHNNIEFFLSPDQASTFSGYEELGARIQLRFCLLETSCEQNDNFPPGIFLEVNNMPYCLGNQNVVNESQGRRKKSYPIDITSCSFLDSGVPNKIFVSYNHAEANESYVLSVNLVRKINASVLSSRLRSQVIKNPDCTRAMIKEKLIQGQDSDIDSTTLKTSLICPISLMRLETPCRPVKCTHIQCFDLDSFLKMNEVKPSWICAVCRAHPATLDSLSIDGFFIEILSKAPSNCTEVEFHRDGSWSPVVNQSDGLSFDNPVNTSNRKTEVIDISREDTSAKIFDAALKSNPGSSLSKGPLQLKSPVIWRNINS